MENASSDEIVASVKKCPSGALSIVEKVGLVFANSVANNVLLYAT